MKVTRSVAVVTALASCTSAFALPAFLKVFQSTYPAPKNSALASARCGTCHVGSTTKLNPYGMDVQKAMKAAKGKSVTPAILRAVEKLDSDKDGKKNGAEIKKGTNPGDPKSK